jgi:xanthine dehydrogenase YagS FAD-binding subunit
MPWRDTSAEDMLRDKPAEEASFRPVADHILRDAQGFGHNDFKIDLARRAIVRALSQALAGTPQTQTDKRIQ